jgi:putative copper resistance protein D
MTAGVWEFASVFAKWLGLLAMAGVVGGILALALARRAQFPEQAALRCYLLVAAVLGLLATPLYFLLQVGAVNQAGIPGMFDPAMVAILLQSGLGQVMGLRMSGFALTLLVVMMAVYFRHRSQLLVAAVAALLLCVSFVLTGHISTLPLMSCCGLARCIPCCC